MLVPFLFRPYCTLNVHKCTQFMPYLLLSKLTDNIYSNPLINTVNGSCMFAVLLESVLVESVLIEVKNNGD